MNGIQGCGLRGKPTHGAQNFSSCVREQASKQPLDACSKAGAASGRAADAMTAANQAIRGSGRFGGMEWFACVLTRLVADPIGFTGRSSGGNPAKRGRTRREAISGPGNSIHEDRA